ncbi:MAG TPA: hypothetical protein VM531_11255 [Sphingomicrobium sp.]|nr:hypothetical protein [Sphingomicrobium sp.]
MTEEQKSKMAQRRYGLGQRNQDICAYYQSGQTIASCSKKFGLQRQRIQQILKQGEVWRPRVKSGRTTFLGVSVNEETKKALHRKARSEGLSVSKLASDALDKLVK